MAILTIVALALLAAWLIFSEASRDLVSLTRSLSEPLDGCDEERERDVDQAREDEWQRGDRPA